MSRNFRPVVTRMVLALAASAACALGAAPALAADAPPAAAKAPPKPPAKPVDARPAEGSLGKGTSSGPVLTKEQLRQCIAEQGRQKQEGAGLVQTQAELAKARAEIDRLGTEMAADLAALDRTSEAAVNAYNEKVRERVKLTEAYQAATPAFNQRIDKLEADKLVFAKDCADRRYREDDFDAIQAGK